MPWFKVDDGLAFHAKVVAAGNAAVGLWARAGAWCSQQLTDGFVPEHIALTMGTKAEIKRLVTVHLWVEKDGGYQFWQWDEPGRQPSRIQVEAERHAARERQRVARERAKSQRESRRDSAVTNSVSNAPVTPAVTVPPTRPDPTRPEVPNGTSDGPRKRGTRLPEDWKPSREDVDWQRQHGISDLLARREHERFVNHWLGESGAKASKLDWSRAWRNWLLRAEDQQPKRRAVGDAGHEINTWSAPEDLP